MTSNLGKNTEIRFKRYEQNQLVYLPVLLEELVKENHQVQVINSLIDNIELSLLSEGYSAFGSPAYHPKMLLKVWIYAYCQGIYTSRKLAKKLREDICFMWLSGSQSPSFKTLASFRSVRMEGVLSAVLSEVLYYLLEQDYIDINDLYIDGSKWEANANKYKIVWSKNTARYKAGVLQRISEFLSEIESLQKEEDARYGSEDLAESTSTSGELSVVLNSSELSACVSRVEELVSQTQDKKRKQKLKSACRKLQKEQPKLAKYEHQEELLAGRNSYVKTDTDATGLRMKDEQLRPGYNVQITSSHQYILHSTIHQNASDSPTLIPHLETLQAKLLPFWKEKSSPSIGADAGYGSEENYHYLAQAGMKAFVKYPLWYQEHTGKIAQKKYANQNWVYHSKEDYYLCPENRKLSFQYQSTRQTSNGYTQHYKLYECDSCQDCPVFRACRGEKAKAESNRKIRRNEKLLKYQAEAREILGSEIGKEKRSQRGVDVETPFGDIKHNMQHRRFLLRGLQKVEVEFNLLAVAHNIRKIECEQTGKWKEYYAQRAAKKPKNTKKAA